MIEELRNRIWAHTEFHRHRTHLTGAWLQRELALDRTLELSDTDLVRCLQSATVLASAKAPELLGAAYGIAACAADLGRDDLPGLAGALRVVLTRMGNFPALASSHQVSSFRRLPTQVAMAEEIRRDGNRVDLDGVHIVLTDFQRELWRDLSEGNNVSVSAPTSAGKSFVLQTYLRWLARRGKLSTACYLVPSRALIAQVTDAVTEWRRTDELSHFQIVNVPLPAETPLPTAAIHVLTQERLLATLGAHPEFYAEVIICDEAQGVEDGARGVLLNNVIDRLLASVPKAQVIFAGPNIRNPGVFRQIFDLSSLKPVQTHSPAVLQNLIIVNTRSPLKRLALESLTVEGRRPLGEVELGRVLPSVTERLVRVAERFGQAKPSIVYANRPVDAEKVALGLAEVSDDAGPDPRIADLVALVKMAVHDLYDLAPCLQRRIGFHYGRIPALVRRAVEAAFADGTIRYLVTTSTLMQGVNFPAANLFVCKPKKGSKPFAPGEFWNLAGRAGRLGREFQGNVFLIDYDEWESRLAEQGTDIEVESALKRTLGLALDAVVNCALDSNPQRETKATVDIEATFARLLSDFVKGRAVQTLDRCGVATSDRERLMSALGVASGRVSLPAPVLAASPTVSPIRQQRLADYFESELTGGGKKRLEELLPRHPRDEDALKALCEVFRVCHENVLSFQAPKLHVRMAAIALKWMRGEPLPAIVDENHRREGGKNMATVIRNTLTDIEEDVRFKYFRLAICYISVFSYILEKCGYKEYIGSLPALPSYLEVGASDPTMVSFIGLGLSRVVARVLTERTMNKEMNETQAVAWLRAQDLAQVLSSGIMRADAERALANALA